MYAKNLRRYSCLLLLSGLTAVFPAAAQTVVVTDLGSPAGYNTRTHDINNLGQIIGTIDRGDPPFVIKAFIWKSGEFKELPTLAGLDTWAVGINQVGQVIGGSRITVTSGYPPWHAFFWEGGDALTDIGTFGGGYSSATAINNLGQVTGSAYACPTDCPFPFVWEKGMTGPAWLPGSDMYTWVRDINDAGTIIANGHYSSGRSLLWKKGATGAYEWPTDLLGQADTRHGRVLQINKLGQVLGSLADTDGVQKLFLWDNGSVTVLPLPVDVWTPYARLNNLGQVAATTVQTIREATVDSILVWDRGVVTDVTPNCLGPQVVDLNDFGQIAAQCSMTDGIHGMVRDGGKWIDLGSMGTFGGLSAMNDMGQIAGQRVIDGKNRATMWSIPVSPLASIPAIDNIATLVNQTMSGAGATALTQQLNVVKNALTEYRTQAACRLLQAMRTEIEAKVNSGKLSPADGQQLIDAIGSVAACAG